MAADEGTEGPLGTPLRRLALALALVVVVAGAAGGTAWALGGGGTAAPAAFGGPVTTFAGTGGPAAAAADTSGLAPSDGAQLTPLFLRTTADQVDIRAYAASTSVPIPCLAPNTPAGGSTAPGTAIVCGPVPTPCPDNADCATPLPMPARCASGCSVPGAAAGTAAGGTTDTTGTTSTTVTSGGTGSVKAGTPNGCSIQSVVVELSNAAAVGTGAALMPSGGSGGLTVLASGTFGQAEGSPVDWVIVSVPSGTSSVRLDAGDDDAMAPVDGLAVLAVTGQTTLDGSAVDALDASGAVASTVTVAAGTSNQPVPAGCPTGPPPTTTTVPPTTTTVPPTTTTTVGPPTGVGPITPPTTTTVPPTTTTTVGPPTGVGPT